MNQELQLVNQNGQFPSMKPLLRSLNFFPTNYHFFTHFNNFLQEIVFNKQAISSRTLEFHITRITETYYWQQSNDSNSYFFY